MLKGEKLASRHRYRGCGRRGCRGGSSTAWASGWRYCRMWHCFQCCLKALMGAKNTCWSLAADAQGAPPADRRSCGEERRALLQKPPLLPPPAILFCLPALPHLATMRAALVFTLLVAASACAHPFGSVHGECLPALPEGLQLDRPELAGPGACNALLCDPAVCAPPCAQALIGSCCRTAAPLPRPALRPRRWPAPTPASVRRHGGRPPPALGCSAPAAATLPAG